MENVDYTAATGGNTDLYTMTSSTYGVDCGTACSSNSNCVGFVVHYPSSGSITCTLKSAMNTRSVGVASVVAYVVDPNGSAMEVCTVNSPLSFRTYCIIRTRFVVV